MTGTTSTIPRAIERGLRSVRSLPSCEVENVPRFDATAKQWVVSMWLRIEHAGPFVGTRTKWCVLLDEAYPYGRIAFYPAAEGGLSSTFPHQDRNTANRGRRGWRSGKLCLDSPFRGERRPTNARDPIGDVDARLRWHVERALAWLEAAAAGRLLDPGDPFELPSRPHTGLKEWAKLRLVHDESAREFRSWSGRQGFVGTVDLGAVPGIEGVIGAGSFVDQTGTTVRSWMGRPLVALDETVSGVWWLWPQPIVVPPWQAPGSWGELRRAGRAMGLDVDSVLERLAPSLRGIKTRTILLLGYPIPTHAGSEPTEVHWDGVLLPQIPPAAGKPPRGFRPNARGWWQRDRRESFGDKVPLEYLRTENWSGDRLHARGRLPASLLDAHVVILGVGALGSNLAEQLVRAGLKKIALVDDDLVAAGNVCRHVATLDDVGDRKVRAVARRLLQISPLVQVSEFDAGISADRDAMVNMLDAYDVIVDCTASDEALSLLARGWWSIPRVFASFSLGFGANRLFSFGVTGHEFSQGQFAKEVAPWLRDETSTWAGSEELLEGAGCWSPLFPARHDDVVLAASICVKELEALTAQRSREPRFRVFEKRESAEGFTGFSLGTHLPPPLEVPQS